MRLVLTNNGSYPRVGDRPQERKLRKAISRFERGKISARQLGEIENQVTAEVIREQIAAGVELVTDGMVRWYDPVSHVACSLENVRVGGLLRFFDTNYLFRQPVVEGKPRWIRSLLASDTDFAVHNSTRLVKSMLMGPYTTARLSVVNDPDLKGDIAKLTMAYAEAFANEVEAMAGAGAKVIQVDEPMLLAFPKDVGLVRECLEVLAERRGRADLALYTYFGDAAKLYGDFQDMPVQIVGLDFTYSEDLISNIEVVGSSKVLGLGLLDGRNTRMDDQETVFRALDRILPRVSTDSCYLNPSCGLEFLPRDRARRKLELMTSLRYRYLHAGGK
jgi:5-methyltetrahydropteroyltriglutamate--homocysteine methyltransferase